MKINGLIFLGAILAVLGVTHIFVAVCLYVIPTIGKAEMAMPPFQLITTIRFWYLVGGLAALLLGSFLAYRGRQK